MSNETKPHHLRITDPSPWVSRFAHLIEAGSSVLDLAAGGGRHGRLFLEKDCHVTFLDKNVEALDDLEDVTGAHVVKADLEDGSPWPLTEQTFDAVIVVNYLHRDLFDNILASLKPSGVLIYETFARGNEQFARPRNPDHLLKSGELLDLAGGRLQVVAYEHGLIETAELPGVKQRLVAVNDLDISEREDGDPAPHPIHP